MTSSPSARSRRPATISRRSAIAAALLSFALVSTSCDSSSSSPAGLTLPPDQPGRFAVGYRELQLTYTPLGETTTRTVPVAMWYPADPAATAALPAPESPVYLYVQSTLAVIDAPPAAPDFPGGYPVIVHSHGHLGWENQAYWRGEGLAALGYVVIGPGHVGDRIQNQSTFVETVDGMYHRVTDIHATLDLLENLPAGDPFRGRCNTEKVILSGHSRGTNTVWAALGAQFDSAAVQARCDNGDFTAGGGCTPAQVALYDANLGDPRIVGGVPMAGDGAPDWFVGTYAGMNAVTVPVLLLSGTLNPVGNDQIWANATSPTKGWADFAGGCHELFTLGACPTTDIDNAVAQPAINTYINAFARRHIFDDTNASVVGILDGSTPVSAIVTYQHR